MTTKIKGTLAIAAIILAIAGIAFLRHPAQLTETKESSYSPEQLKSEEQRFSSQCGFCHGRDARGGESGPDLTRSKLVKEDKGGDQIGPLLRAGRPDKGMPPFNLNEQDLGLMVAFLHAKALGATSHVIQTADLATGNADAGRVYFNGLGGCSACHSASGDLKGVASRYEGVELLQRMLYPKGSPEPTPPKVTVTLRSGQTVTGPLDGQDEFRVKVLDAKGVQTKYDRSEVQVKIEDPMSAHYDQLEKYTDDDMHHVFAYLSSLK